MKIRAYKQVVELGHYVWSGDRYWDDWVVDSVIEEADEVLKYVIEAKKKTTSFGGVFTIQIKWANFAFSIIPLEPWKLTDLAPGSKFFSKGIDKLEFMCYN